MHGGTQGTGISPALRFPVCPTQPPRPPVVILVPTRQVMAYSLRSFLVSPFLFLVPLSVPLSVLFMTFLLLHVLVVRHWVRDSSRFA